jgi:Protein of unknown function (DUF3102)
LVDEPTALKPEALSLPDLGKKIKSDHEQLTNNLRYIAPRAISIGEDLNKAKVLAGHGGFLKWVKLNCAMTNKTAERYMNLATNKDKLLAKLREKGREGDEFEMLSNLSLAQCERLITEPNSSSGGDNASDAYDRAEKKLIEKLNGFSLGAAEAAVAETIRQLNQAVELMKNKNIRKAA